MVLRCSLFKEYSFESLPTDGALNDEWRPWGGGERGEGFASLREFHNRVGGVTLPNADVVLVSSLCPSSGTGWHSSSSYSLEDYSHQKQHLMARRQTTITMLILVCFFFAVGALSGGSALYIETAVPRPLASSTEKKEAEGSLQLTGHLGDVMKESANIAFSVAKSFLLSHDPENDFLQKAHVHLHVPEVTDSPVL